MPRNCRLAAAAIALLVPALLPAQDLLVQPGERRFSRVLRFGEENGRPAVPLQYWVAYGAPEWKAEYEAAIKGAKKGTRFRLGKDVWTCLETNRPLTAGGVKVPAGSYFLTIEKGEQDKLALVLLDAAKVLAARQDAFQSAETKGGILVPLARAASDSPAPTLAIDFVANEKKKDETTLTIRFGPLVLTAPVAES